VVKRTKILAVVLASATGLTATALTSVERHLSAPDKRAVLQAAANSQKNSGQKGKRQGPHMGEWLESHKNLPLDQQEKALEKDPNFKKLPPDRQAALQERLRKFNSLSPDQRDLAIKRMNFWAALTKDQRQQLRDASQQLQGLPPERRIAVHKALRHLRQMDPQQRQKVMASDRFKSIFSDQEQGILKNLATINPPENEDHQPSAPATESPRP